MSSCISTDIQNGTTFTHHTPSKPKAKLTVDKVPVDEVPVAEVPVAEVPVDEGPVDEGPDIM